MFAEFTGIFNAPYSKGQNKIKLKQNYEKSRNKF